jgi:glutamyl-Q tRNA(Asp) synthetase
VPDTEPAAVRFRVPSGAPVIHDRLQGEITQDLAQAIGDFVIRRRDRLHAYQLAVVVDDAALGVTDVVRGADLLDSTPRQVVLQQALRVPTPRYLHVPVATRGGEKLSKQTLAPAIDTAQGLPALRAALSFLGQPAGDTDEVREASAVLTQAVAAWDPCRISRARSNELPDG